MPSAQEVRRLTNLKKTLNDFQSVFLMLQRANVTIVMARRLFDALIVKYPSLGGHIGREAEIIHSNAFENGLVKLGTFAALSIEETVAMQPLIIAVDQV